jgi:hypothetical protein
VSPASRSGGETFAVRVSVKRPPVFSELYPACERTQIGLSFFLLLTNIGHLIPRDWGLHDMTTRAEFTIFR